jgi:hypothetical protein
MTVSRSSTKKRNFSTASLGLKGDKVITPETKVQKLLRKQSTAFLISAMLSSICIVLIGVIIEQKSALASRILIILGSSGMGTCLGMVFGSITGSSAVNRITELVESTLSSSIYAKEESLEGLRKTWNHYLCTKIGDEYVWRYRVIDFSRIVPSGKLVAILSVPGPDGLSHVYHLEAFITGSRLVIVQTAASGTEEPVISVYPSASQRFRSLICGFTYIQSWNGSQFLTASMMSQNQIIESKKSISIGTVDKEHNLQLSDTWKSEADLVGIGTAGFQLPE